MILKLSVLEKVRSGEVRMVFRRWIRPSVRAGGTLKTALGVLAIDAVTPTRESELTEEAARSAGFESRAQLLSELRAHGGTLYRIDLRYAGADPRVALRANAKLSTADLTELCRRLERIDRASRSGPWTTAVLRLIRARPARLAARLASHLGLETPAFKRNVRKLKELGLTESLEIGYRLSPRGEVLLRYLDAAPTTDSTGAR